MNSKPYTDARNSIIADAVNNLHEALIPKSGELINVPSRRKIYLFDSNNTCIYLLVKGELTVCRLCDNIGVAMAISPSVLGIAHAHSVFYGINSDNSNDHSYSNKYYGYSESECSYYKCPLSVFVEEIENANLWHDIARVLAGVIHELTFRETYLSSGDVYHTIRPLLIELLGLPKEIRSQINAQKYIQTRTGISRSRIMSILSALRKGGYITIDRGKLIDMTELPDAF